MTHRVWGGPCLYAALPLQRGGWPPRGCVVAIVRMRLSHDSRPASYQDAAERIVGLLLLTCTSTCRRRPFCKSLLITSHPSSTSWPRSPVASSPANHLPRPISVRMVQYNAVVFGATTVFECEEAPTPTFANSNKHGKPHPQTTHPHAPLPSVASRLGRCRPLLRCPNNPIVDHPSSHIHPRPS